MLMEDVMRECVTQVWQSQLSPEAALAQVPGAGWIQLPSSWGQEEMPAHRCRTSPSTSSWLLWYQKSFFFLL
jgi:hypothetical protein